MTASPVSLLDALVAHHDGPGRIVCFASPPELRSHLARPADRSVINTYGWHAECFALADDPSPRRRVMNLGLVLDVYVFDNIVDYALEHPMVYCSHCKCGIQFPPKTYFKNSLVLLL